MLLGGRGIVLLSPTGQRELPSLLSMGTSSGEPGWHGEGGLRSNLSIRSFAGSKQRANTSRGFGVSSEWSGQKGERIDPKF